MENVLIVSVFILIILLFSVISFLLSSERTIVYAKKRVHYFNRLTMRHKEQLANSELESQLRSLELPITLYNYQVIRFSVIGTLAALCLVSFLISGISNVKLLILLLIIFAFIYTKPVARVLGIKSFLKMILDALQESKRTQFNNELYLMVSQLRNSFKVYGENAPSSTEIFGELLKYTNKLKPIFQKFLSFWISGEQERSLAYFKNAVGTNEASKLVQLFEKMDYLSPDDLDDQFKTFQQIFRSERETKRTKKDEQNSNIVFTLVVVACFMIMIDFIAVGLVVDLFEMTEGVF